MVFYLWTVPESVLCRDRRDINRGQLHAPNVRRSASTKLTLSGSALESRISSPSENIESCKSSPSNCSSDRQTACATPPLQMRPPNENTVTHARGAGRTGILVAQTQDSLRRRAMTNHPHLHMQTHDARSSHNRERRSIEAFTLCGGDVSVRQRHSHNW